MKIVDFSIPGRSRPGPALLVDDSSDSSGSELGAPLLGDSEDDSSDSDLEWPEDCSDCSACSDSDELGTARRSATQQPCRLVLLLHLLLMMLMLMMLMMLMLMMLISMGQGPSNLYIQPPDRPPLAAVNW